MRHLHQAIQFAVTRSSILMLGLFLLTSCNASVVQPTSTATLPARAAVSPTVAATSTHTAIPTPVVEPSATPAPPTLYIAPYLPVELRAGIAVSATIQQAENDATATYWLGVGSHTSTPIGHWIYALVAPFPTITEEVRFSDLAQAWAGDPESPLAGQTLLMDQATLDLFTAWMAGPVEGLVRTLPADQILDEAWSSSAWAIIPFEAIEPRWKVITVDGQSPLHADFDPLAYPLAVPIVLLDELRQDMTSLPQGLSLPLSNRDSNRLTSVALTGVTALVRGTAVWMERYGITYPAEDVGPLLASADITHISNEIPFTPECPFPVLQPSELVFCSSPSYIELLDTLSPEVIELTGDHFGDWGAEAMHYTLDLYTERNWPVYGGGANSEAARSPVLIEHNGNRIAFLGCNIGCQVKNEVPCDEYATPDLPGAATCDFDWLETEIPRLRADGYQVVFTFQHKEYYSYQAQPDLVRDFGRVAAAGAAVVSGSQSHQPHGMAFENGAFIHYGLGNLFFDQYHYCANFACDNGFIDWHIFYDGRYLGVELIPIHFIDLARPRLMTPAERAAFLELIFEASDW